MSSLKEEKEWGNCYVNDATARFTAKNKRLYQKYDTTSYVYLYVPTMLEALSFTSQQLSCR
ncbi:hypothetical protein PIOMA14_I_0758 [Prevotella intermedia]|uniref:Uncharacterized protein n=1 Tax=Prevotella intermedia TaxID=28131 RepID=A0A0S3UIC5_PREIN|nr:hypothetical protein PIOMA14_I_0758 [Prevotella intermedia]